MVYAQGLGLDYKDGKYIVYMQLMNLSMLAKSDASGGNGKDMNSEIGQASGSTLEDAVFNLYKTSQRRIHWGHLNYIFLSENAIKQQGLQDVIDLLDRYFETHYRMWIYSTNEPISSVMNTDPPINMSNYLSRINDPDAAFEQYSYIQSLDMREVLISHFEPPHEMVIPNVNNNKKNWKGEKDTRHIGVINGMSIIANNKHKGLILNKDANGYRWIEKKFKRTAISVRTEDNGSVGLTVVKRKVKIEPIIKNNKVQFDIHIKATAVINKLDNNTPVSELRREAEKVIAKEVLHTYLKGLEFDSDIYRLSYEIYKRDLSVWRKLEQEGKIPLKEDSIRKIDVDVMIKDGGKQRKMPTLEK
jgi:Ger(x)C family germination protein